MTQTLSSRKRSRELEDIDLLPSPKRIDVNFNSASHINNHLNGTDEMDGSSKYLQNGTCYHGESSSAQCQRSSHQPATSPLIHHQTDDPSHPTLPTQHNHWPPVSLDTSTCTALSNLHLIPQDQPETSLSDSRTQEDESSAYRDINRVLREAHFARLARLNGSFRDGL